MDIKTLESFKLGDAIFFHDELNTNLWDLNNKLRPEVKDQLITIAKDFIDELGIKDLDVKDITISGSNAAYTYTKHSDLDLHILVDMNKLPNDEVYREFFNARKNLYNDSHDITIHGVPVELYVQDSNEPVVSLGEYSILKDKWLRIPTKRRANFDQTATKQKYDKLLDIIKRTLKSKDLEKVNDIITTIKRYRKAGLDKGGEFGPENLAYKALRTQEYIDKLYKLRDKLHSEELSIEEDNKLLDKPTMTPEQLARKHGVAKMHILKQLDMGIKVELEHTSGREVAREIALDHLGEDPNYYTKLSKANLEEVVSPDFFNKPEDAPYMPPTEKVKMGDFEFDARNFRGGLAEPNAQGLQIRAYDPKLPKGSGSIGSADFIMKTDKKGNSWLESEDTDVKEPYRGQGIAAMMYAFAKSLGNDIKPSPYQSEKGRLMWKKWGSDAKNLMKENTDNTITLNQLYGGDFPDKDETFWDYVRPDEFDKPLEIKSLPKYKIQFMLLSQYRIEHLDELTDMMDPDQKEIVEKYINDPSLFNKIIVLADDRIIDGNHRALAAALKGTSIKYVDLNDLENQELDEAKVPSVRDQILADVKKYGGSPDEYFVRFTDMDKLGFSGKQWFGKTPDVDDPKFDVDYIGHGVGRRALWFYPLSTYLNQAKHVYASEQPYAWLVKLKSNAWLQTVKRGDKIKQEAPRGKERVGLLRMSDPPAAIFFTHGYDVIGKYYNYASKHRRHGQVKGKPAPSWFDRVRGLTEENDYMAGHCHVMALALKQLHSDWQLKAHIGWDEEAEDDNDYRVDHVYIVAPDGSAYDCRGRFDNEQELVGPDETGGVETQFVDYSIDDIKNDILRGELKKFNKQDLENAIKFASNIVSEDLTNQFAAEKTPVINPHAGLKDNQFRGAISEMPDTSGPVGVQPGGWRTYKPRTIDEAFDQPYPLQWEKSEFGDYDALAQLSDGSYLSIMFNNEEMDEWDVIFYRGNTTAISGKGDAQRVFATVLNAIGEFIKKEEPESIRFSAEKADDPKGSRANLYTKLVQRYASSWGYRVQTKDQHDAMWYRLVRIKNIKEASGYIPSEKEKNDPRFKTALTVDIKPDTMKKDAKKFGNTISRAGIPPTLKASGKF